MPNVGGVEAWAANGEVYVWAYDNHGDDPAVITPAEALELASLLKALAKS